MTLDTSWRRRRSQVCHDDRVSARFRSRLLGGKRQRPLDTVTPLAQDLGLTVDTSCDRDDPDCVKDVVDSYDGPGNILICVNASSERSIRHDTELTFTRSG